MNDFKPPALQEQKMSVQPRPRSGRRWIWAVIVVALVAGLAGMAALMKWQAAAPSGNPAASAAARPAAVPVSVVTVEPRDIAIWTDFSGRLEAVNRVEVRPRAGGAIVAAHFREGSNVKQGDLLFTIDPAPYEAEVDRLEAQVTSAGARLVLAAKQQQRGFQLGGASDLAKSEVDQRVNEYRAAEANLRAATAALRTAKLNLGYTEVRAPIDGRVGRIEVTPGNLVPAGPAAPVLTTLVSADPIYASFDADEGAVARAVASLPHDQEPSQAIDRIPVQLGTLSAEGTPLRGHLQWIDNVVAAASGTVRVRAVFDNADGRLMPGQFARLRLGEAKTEPVIAIDEQAIGTDQDRRFVMVVDADNKVSSRQVTLGRIADGLRIVTSGLRPGERIVVDGLQRIGPGSIVAPRAVAQASGQAASSDTAAR